MNPRLKLALPVLLVAAGALGAWEIRRADVVVTPVTRGVAVDAVYATGTVEADDRASVKARLGGSIAECLVREGDVVKKGDILARLDNPGVTFALQRGQTQLTAANQQAGAQSPQITALASQASSIRAEMEYAKADLDRTRKLAASGSSTSIDLDKATTHLAQLDAQLRANQAQQDALRIDLDSNAAQIAQSVKALASQVSDTEVRSPLDGVVLRRHVEPGEVVAQNQALFEVGDTSRLVLRVAIDEADVGKVTTDPPSVAVASLVAFRDRAFHGHVTRIFPDADRATKSFVAYVVLDDPPKGLRSGMTAEVNIIALEKDGVLLAPMESVDGHAVWVVQDGRARRREVTLGIHDLLSSEVVSGLSEGELVVVDGQASLVDGARVSTRAAAASLPPPVAVASAGR
jgi:HlyD family secretion protein